MCRCYEMARHPKSWGTGWGSQAQQGQVGLVVGSLAILPGTSSFQFSPEMARHSSRLQVPQANWCYMWLEMRRHPCQKFGVSLHFIPPERHAFLPNDRLQRGRGPQLVNTRIQNCLTEPSPDRENSSQTVFCWQELETNSDRLPTL